MGQIQFPAINKLKQSYEYTNILVSENQIKKFKKKKKKKRLLEILE